MILHRYINSLFNQCKNVIRIKSCTTKVRCYCINTNKGDSSQIISILNVKRIIKASGFDMDDGYTSIKTACPACDDSKNTNKIYINKITGNFICTTCQNTGKWNSIEKFFASSKSSRTNKEVDKYKDIFIKSKSKKEIINLPNNLMSLKNMSDKDIVDILDNMKIYDISSTVLQNLDVKFDGILNKLYFPLIDVDSTVVGYKIMYYDAQSEKIVEETFPKANSYGLITSKSNVHILKRDCQTAIIVLNILDLLILATNKINYTIVCLPHNSQSLPQQCLPQLESFNKLILWFSCDAAGWDTARNFAKKLDEKRCLFVRPTDAHPAPYEAVQHGFDLKTIVGKAQPILHKAITTFSALRQDVLSDLQNIDKVQGVKWKRFPSLNKFLKGHRKGELTVLTGPTGCGKTTFMSEYSLDLAMQGVTTLWGSFEIRNTRLASTLLQQLAGRPLDENLVEFEYWADEFERFPIYFMTFHGQQSIKVVMDAIDHAQYVHDIQHVIIDNVQFMMGIGEEPKNNDRFWKQDVLIAAFRTFATKKNCHVTLVIHPRKERDADDLTTSSIFGGAKASQEADNVLIIQDKRLTSIRGKKYLQVAKNRYSGDLGIMPLEFDKSGLSYAQRRKKTEDKGGGNDSIERVKE